MIAMPSTQGVQDPVVKRALDAIIQQLKIFGGQAGTSNERSVTLGELKTLGIIGEDARGKSYRRIPDTPAPLTDHDETS